MAVITESVVPTIYGYYSDAPSDAGEDSSPLARKLVSFAKLPRGWSHGEGEPMTPGVLRKIRPLVSLALAMPFEADVFPGLNGEAAITFYNGDRSVEVIVNVDGAYDVHVEQGAGLRFRRIASLTGATYVDALGKVLSLFPANDEWTSLESSPCDSSTVESSGFRMLSSSTQAGPIRRRRTAA